MERPELAGRRNPQFNIGAFVLKNMVLKPNYVPYSSYIWVVLFIRVPFWGPVYKGAVLDLGSKEGP